MRNVNCLASRRTAPPILSALVCLCLAQSGCGGAEGGAPLACAGDRETRATLRSVCEYFMTREVGSRGIFVAGYASRTLVAGFSVFGEPRYLHAAIAFADGLVGAQLDTGYWRTGYSENYYLADTGSALGVLFLVYPLVDADRRTRYLAAVQRHVDAIERDGLVRPSGALGTGWRFQSAQDAHVIYDDEYTIASALCGAQVFTWLYLRTGRARYLAIARDALAWVFGTMRADGVVPYVLAGEGADLALAGDRANDRKLWDDWRFNTAGYVGEGVIAFHTHCDRPEWREDVEARVRPIVDMLVRSQNADGSWSAQGSDDQKRSPGVVNLLVWYHTRVEARADVAAAVCRFAALHHDVSAARSMGMQSAGADVNHANAIITALGGRALASIVAPGSDVRW